MADELKHKAVGTVLTQVEFEATDSHAFADQATGDILYASSTTQLSRLGKAADNTILTLSSNIPAWTATPTLTTVDATTDFTVGTTVVADDVITFTPTTNDTVTLTAATNGAFSLVTVDTAAAAANIQITADGTVDIDSAGILTLDSGAAINIEPAGGSAILLDGTISIDAGVITGATAITSETIDATTDFTIGTTVITDDVITFTPTTSDTVTMTAATNGAFSLVTVDNAAAAANIQITADGTVDIDSAGALTLDSGAAINLEPAAGSVILLDGTLTIDAGVVVPVATAHDTAGTAISISAGATTAGTTNNIAGGALTIQGGQGKGSGAGGDIIFQTANAGGSGSSINALATALTISDDLSATFAGTASFTGIVDVTNATDSSDASGDTGALRTEGGASIAKKLYVGTDLDVDGTAELDNITIGGAQGSDGEVLTSTGSGVGWEAAVGGALVRVGGNTTEATTTSTSAVDLLSVSSLSIGVASPIMLMVSARKTAGAADDVAMGLKLNSTIVGEATTNTHALWGGTTTNHIETGCSWLMIPPRNSAYPKAVLGIREAYAANTAGVTGTVNISRTADIPTATITDVVIRGITDNSSNTLAADELHVYTLADS